MKDKCSAYNRRKRCNRYFLPWANVLFTKLSSVIGERLITNRIESERTFGNKVLCSFFRVNGVRFQDVIMRSRFLSSCGAIMSTLSKQLSRAGFDIHNRSVVYFVFLSRGALQRWELALKVRRQCNGSWPPTQLPWRALLSRQLGSALQHELIYSGTRKPGHNSCFVLPPFVCTAHIVNACGFFISSFTTSFLPCCILERRSNF